MRNLSIKNNFQTEKLHLDGNWIECNGAKYLSRMIRQNDFITELVSILFDCIVFSNLYMKNSS